MKSYKSVQSNGETDVLLSEHSGVINLRAAPGVGAAGVFVLYDRPVYCLGKFRKKSYVSGFAGPSAGLWELFAFEKQQSSFSWSAGEKRLRRAVWGAVSQVVRGVVEKLPSEHVPVLIQ